MAGLKIHRWLALACLVTACLANSDLRADLIFDPSQSQTILDGNQNWDQTVNVTGLNLNFFGQSIQSLWIAENGNLNFSANEDFFTLPLGTTSIARLSPLWDDYLMLQDATGSINNRVSGGYVAGSHFVVTWENVRLFSEALANQNFPDTTRSAQIAWFESSQNVRGFNFLQDDIAFSYLPHVSGTTDFGDYLFATVGLDRGNGTFSALPGTPTGEVTKDNSQLLPAQTNQFLLFRWDAMQGNYTASIEQFTAVPESSYTPLIISACCAGAVLIHRRRLRGFVRLQTTV